MMIPFGTPVVTCPQEDNGCGQTRIPLTVAMQKPQNLYCHGCAALRVCGKSVPIPADVQLRPTTGASA